MRCYLRVVVIVLLVCVAHAEAQFPSSNMTLASQLSLNQMEGGSSGADLWGWTDPLTGHDYALMTSSTTTSFVDVTDPFNPVYVGNLPSPTGSDTVWRDVKTYNNHAYIVADGSVGPHGLQVFDLTNLRGVTAPQTFSSTDVDNTFRNAHNVVINEESGYAYVVGSDEQGGRALAFNLANPANPQFESTIEVDGYIHDAQVVNYHGPDPDHQGSEIMFSASVNDFVIIDVTSKPNAFRIWEDFHPNTQYTHQGWLSEDHTTFYINDELDDRWTHKWDVTDVDNPVYRGSINETAGTALDHNLYVKGKYVYQANYTAGVRIFESTNNPVADAEDDLQEVGWLDTYPESNAGDPDVFSTFTGAWSVYPFFESGTIISSDLARGLFVSRNDVRPADFNADGYVDCTDIDQLTAAIAADSSQPWFDLTGDGNLDLADLDQWLVAAGAENLGSGNRYLAGDMNLDGNVDGADFLIWNANKFAPGDAWCRGDLNADGTVDGADFLVWNTNKFQSSDASSGNLNGLPSVVPEPNLLALLWAGALLAIRVRK
jgi:choice-of-anchor B domain-containing protein